MNSWEKERAEQEAADQVEERRVAREDEAFRAEEEKPLPSFARSYIFADERSQRRAEQAERFYGPIDDYAAFLDRAPPYEQLIR